MSGGINSHTQHIAVRDGAVSLHESFHDHPNGVVTGRFAFRDGPALARGVFSIRNGTYTFSFRISGRPRVDHISVTENGIERANFAGCTLCGGFGNVGAFEGLGNASRTSGNMNTGVFNGDFNGAAFNGNGNLGAFNGNFNGLGYAPNGTNGSYNGNRNKGFFNGNLNGDATAHPVVLRAIALVISTIDIRREEPTPTVIQVPPRT